MRPRLARALVRLASRIDTRPDVRYTISHDSPKSWAGIKRTVRRFDGSLLGDPYA